MKKQLNPRQVKILGYVINGMVKRDANFVYRYSKYHECDRTIYSLEGRGLIRLTQSGDIIVTALGEAEWARLSGRIMGPMLVEPSAEC